MRAPSHETWWRFLLRYLRPEWRRFLLMTVLLLGGIGLQLGAPQVASRFIDSARAGGAIAALTTLALLYLALAVANQLANAFATYVGQDVGWTTTNRLREDLALHCLRLDMTFHNTHTPGELIERVDGDLTALADFFSIVMIRVLGSGLLLAGTLALLWRADWRIGLALTIFTAITGVVLVSMRRIAIPAGVQERDSSAIFLGFLEERLGGVEDIRANGGGDYVMLRFYESMRRWFHRGVSAWLRRASVWSVASLLFDLGTAVVLGLSALLFVQHAISLGLVYLFFQYTVMLQAPLEQITQQLQEFQKAASSLTRVRAVLRIQPAIVDGAGAFARDAGGNVPAGAVAVAFDDVTFAYHPADGPVLRDFDFQLAPGRVLGLLGRTGSGKTTLSRLLFRLYDVTEGAIRLDGADIRELPLATLRQRVGLVTQDVQLFHATIRDNLTFFDASVADARILAVIAEMGLSEWFARLPNGLDTELEAGGDGLSAGEAQLLAFIRVFLKDPGLVILDEPSSRLDPATEQLIERGVSYLLRDRTGIIIAHRLATVRRADAIMVIENGRILEYGPREELAASPDSRFAALLRVGLEEVLA
jgi:ABC-type multidrug transport system fused ATPase/permease subunit